MKDKLLHEKKSYIPPETADVEPQLNPIHPHHKKKVPRMTLVGLAM